MRYSARGRAPPSAISSQFRLVSEVAMAIWSVRGPSPRAGAAALAVALSFAVAPHSASAQCQTTSFSGVGTQYYTLGNTSASILADLNGDGHLDAASTAWGQPHGGVVFVQLGDGDGGLGPASTVMVNFYKTAGRLLARDVNHDGKLDLAVVLSGTDSNDPQHYRGVATSCSATDWAVSASPNFVVPLALITTWPARTSTTTATFRPRGGHRVQLCQDPQWRRPGRVHVH